ncbi:helix-turn-helix transcriptional regulator [Catalinimonas niigatensis]|uniref:helix-turn-helix transcriptional regulator n=1 Tax=Catalinimonas niigatensis TaxID=1397264 RepID=UPI002666F537|nr:helix-turn-helix transcriptional regulator [Catalinimonas niigatensis]WPP49118.1 helix-turn-helix transcriptional regulator [Catalinimonas niigatensis]
MKKNKEKQWTVRVKRYCENSKAVITIEQPLEELKNSIMILKMLTRDNAFLQKNRERFNSLSDREKEVFFLLAMGYSSEMIGEELFISKHTAQTHRKHLKEKLQIKSYKDMMTYARVFGFI